MCCLGEGRVSSAHRQSSTVGIFLVGVACSYRLRLAGDGVPVGVCRGEGFGGSEGGCGNGGQGVPGEVVGVTVVDPRVAASRVGGR